MDYIIHYDIAALIILSLVMIHFFYKKTINTRQTRLFTYLTIVALFSIVMDLISVYTIQNASAVPLWLNYLININYIASFNWVITIYLQYLVAVIKGSERLTRKEQNIILLPISIETLLIFTTPWTKLVFFFDEHNVYTHGPFIVLIYAVAMVYIILSLVYTSKNKNKLTSTQRGFVYFCTIAVMLTLCIQAILAPNLLIIGFATSLSLLLVYLSLENPESYEDKQLGVFNRQAFVETLSNYFVQKQPFEVLVIQIEGLQYVNETFGVDQGMALMKKIASILSTRSHFLQLFYINQQQYALVGRISKKHWDIILSDIRNRFSQSFASNGTDVMVSGLFCMVAYPHSLSCLEDALDIIDYSMQEAKKYGSETTIYASKDKLNQGRRENQILQIIKQALLDKSFEVYYQPIYSDKEQGFVAAEALIRLKDDTLGFISPEEFIPIAEKNGLILDVGEFVFREVCQFMSQNHIWKYGIKFVDVNLSVVQCMQEQLHERLIAIMDEYHLEYHFINLEITETAAIASNEIIKHNMQMFVDKGMSISLDDYGTGFSNTTTLFQLPFSIIKIDKSVLWTSLENTKALQALKHMIAMIIDMEMDVIVEGVETEEQANMLVQWGCHLHQGYYYSKPLCKDLFLKKIQITE